jgi:uncharacterized membrane protein
LTNPPLAPDGRGPRLAAIDVIRGIAVLGMVVYHFSWDLWSNGLIYADVIGDPWWKAFARTVAGTFIGLSGFNLVLAHRGGFRRALFLRRLAIIAGAAILVSVGTWLVMGDAFVYFGILHCIAVTSVLALAFLRTPAWFMILCGAGAVAAPFYLTDPVFDWPPLLFIGLSPNPRPTVDYVPLLPWFGIVLFGMALGRLALDNGLTARLGGWRPARAFRPLTFIGRWSLPIYLLHQPILIGALSLALPLIGSGQDGLAREFMRGCTQSCEASAARPGICPATCGCVVTGAEGAGLLEPAMKGTMTPEQSSSWEAIVSTCLPKPPEASPGRT